MHNYKYRRNHIFHKIELIHLNSKIDNEKNEIKLNK